MNVDQEVSSRYSAAAKVREAALCCPVDYDKKYLEVIPKEVIDRDYGCGDPSKYLAEGETVLDLGSGGGKICFIASQVVGRKGRVLGVDINDEMLELAEKSKTTVSNKIGFSNVEFRKGKIEDLRLDRKLIDHYLSENQINTEQAFRDLENYIENQRLENPLIKDSSIDVVVSNCVLNLVKSEAKRTLFSEIFRVLRRGGRAVISDIVSDEQVPLEMQRDPELWSGCLSGALQEKEFLQAFVDAGFYGVEILSRDEQPWQTVEGIEFRSMTVAAYKGKEGPCFEHNDAVVYKGPFLSVTDDDGHTYYRGERMAVCRKTKELLMREPYRSSFFEVSPRVEIAAEDAVPFSCEGSYVRDPKVTKGESYKETITGSPSDSNSSCC